MTTRKRIMTTTALGLLIAATPLAVQPALAQERSAGMVLAQAEKPEGMSEEAWRALLKKRGGGKQEESADEEAGEAEEPAPEAPAATPAPAPVDEVPEAAPEADEAPPAPIAEPEAEAPAEPEAAPAAEETPVPEARPENPAPEEAAPEAEEPAVETEEEPAAETTEPAPVEAEEEEPAAPTEEQPAEPEAQESEEEQPAAETAEPEPAAPETATEEPAVEEPVETETEQPETAPAPDEPAADEGQANEEPKAGDAEVEAEAGTDAEAAEEEVLPDNVAPVLDSQKEPEVQDEAQPEGNADAPAETRTAAPEAEAAAPPPESDAEAQAEALDPEALRTEIRNILEEQGERIEMGTTREERRERRRELRQQREDAEIVQEFNDNRTIVEINNQIFVESPDSDRLILDEDEVYYEELQRGRVREVVTRPNGVRLITVRNRYGDVIRRVRVAPDGREQVLVFVPDERLDTVDRWRDPARDLPPLRLTIPVSDYILEAERVENPDRYYTFLEKPPVEPVRRMYSLEEVKRSARVRDMVRRIDLDTVEFGFGSAEIQESEIDELEAIATAIDRMLERNPAETFLIEGHTDAVGSDLANLALSDRRAESVARALTDVFGIPPENLVTQGYGERYLKIDTQARERENRRVALRRITPLVAPVASAN
ncbi:OmpA family protein [Nitratireductor aquimarinus]|uniref:OmpA family protein n=1 Tax=Nitratireductor aquimarinus TaxID=889300 RepID=UPI001A8CFDF2|nr:OmpA family protein [Nitratireductor aquimarinus]MBN8242767.1 OmpA family protein [Nitratireductor aquimarinus]MBY6131867.1 OmpA family protein [Nitratireductor aquimarinus]MCA1301403.1 OmpA family protein [Nitratireductor aquimarinus]